MLAFVVAMLYREGGDPCPACRRTGTTTSSGECLACGHAWGPRHACVHCGVTCGVRAGREAMGPLCRACGLPRVAVDWQMPGDLRTRIVASWRWRRRRDALAATALASFVGWIVVGPILCIWRGWGLGAFAAVPIGLLVALLALAFAVPQADALERLLDEARAQHARDVRPDDLDGSKRAPEIDR